MNGETSRVRLPEQLTGADFDYVRTLVREHTGITLDRSKVYLINARLLPIARELDLPSIAALIQRLRSQAFGELHSRAVEAIVTTETSFYRDFVPFEALERQVIPELIQQRRNGFRSLTIWSAGCSSGQEPYSLAMMIRERFPELTTWALRLLASDVSTSMLERARAGIYSQVEVNRGLPASLLVKYFSQQGTFWTIRDDVRNMVSFFQHNLVRETPTLPPVDILMLRNVLIYFDVETKRLILDRIYRQLRTGGLLVLGTAETTLNLDDRFERVRIGRSVFYRTRKPEAR